jgi:hypothetical protein
MKPTPNKKHSNASNHNINSNNSFNKANNNRINALAGGFDRMNASQSSLSDFQGQTYGPGPTPAVIMNPFTPFEAVTLLIGDMSQALHDMKYQHEQGIEHMKQLLYDISVACGKFLQVLCKEAS